jgi:hypothetical protein
VGPGEGTSTLAIVFVNRGRTDITGVTGYLTLPPGFRAIEGENNVTTPNVAVASYDSTIKAGDTFTMYFTMDVLPQAKVGPYTSDLTLSYSKILEVGQISASMKIPFRITGKVILDIALLEQNLTAGSANLLPILLSNKGTANASGVVATINAINSGTTTTGAVSTRSSSPSSSSLPVSAVDNNTSTNTTENTQDTESTAAASTTDNTLSSDSEQEEESSSATTLIDSRTFDVGIIPVDSSVIVTPIIYPDYSSDGTIQNIELEITYNNAYGIRTTTDYSIGMIVAPNPPESVLSISPSTTARTTTLSSAANISQTDSISDNSIMLTAGKIENVNLPISNNGEFPLSDVVLSLATGSDSIKILGDSRWRFENLAPKSEHDLSTSIYAADSLINTPVEFTVDAEYIEEGQSKTDTLNIGAYIDGQIKIRVYDLAINYVGDAPTLVGNLLNEGNTVALFTTIDLVNSATAPNNQASVDSFLTSRPQQQYLGDLTENSPLPFSIPLELNNDATAGTYPVNLRVTYSDNLRNVHELILNGTVHFEPVLPQSSNTAGSQSLSFIFLLIVAAIAVAATLTSIILVRRRKRKKAFSRTRSLNNLEKEEVDLFLSDESRSDLKR